MYNSPDIRRISSFCGGLLLLVLGCSSSSSEKKLADKTRCYDNSECESGYCSTECTARGALFENCSIYSHNGNQCAEGLVCGQGLELCAKPCADSSACEQGACVYGSCWPTCSPSDPLSQPLVCLDGNLRSCNEKEVYRAACDYCGCATEGVCENSKCVPFKKLGEPCKQTSDCESKNCGIAAKTSNSKQKVCLVGLGEPCTTSNCQLCERNGKFCTWNCQTDNLDISCMMRDGKDFLGCIQFQDSPNDVYVCAPEGAEECSSLCPGWTSNACQKVSSGYTCQLNADCYGNYSCYLGECVANGCDPFSK